MTDKVPRESHKWYDSKRYGFCTLHIYSLMLIDISLKFHGYSLFSVFSSYRAAMATCDRHTKRRTDARGKTIILPNLKGEI